MQPVYVATARIEIDKENANILPFQCGDSYDYMMDTDNYIETQAKILTSETLALQTIRNGGLALRPEFAGSGGISEVVSSGNLANQKRPPELAEFLGSLSVKRVPNSRLMDVSFDSTDPKLAARTVNAHIATYIEQNYRSNYEATSRILQAYPVLTLFPSGIPPFRIWLPFPRGRSRQTLRICSHRISSRMPSRSRARNTNSS